MPRTSVISQDTELPLGVFPSSSRQHAHHALGNLLLLMYLQSLARLYAQIELTNAHLRVTIKRGD